MDNPILTFTLLLTVILLLPPVFERIRLPGLVGLLLAGIVLGQSGLQWLDSDSETMKLLSGIGKIYLMFVAGLEIDLKQFLKTRHRSLGFGWLTFIVPMLTGIVIGHGFGYGWNAAILIGSLLASHTLLSYPIVSRMGAVNNEAVMVTIGATIITDTAALVVLAVCVGIHLGDFTPISFGKLMVGLALYTVGVFVGLDWAGKEFFRRTGNAEGNQFLFVLLALFLSAAGAQVVGVEQIVGAFLAGLAVNDVLGKSPVKEKVEFVGSVLFIPCFFIDMGLLINLPAFLKTLSALWLTLAIVGGLIGSKFVAALLSARLYRYNRSECLTMWSLSLPQVAATLAATLVGYQTLNAAGERLLGEEILNSVLVLMVVTSILGPLITARVASDLVAPASELPPSHAVWLNSPPVPELVTADLFTVVVPIFNPKTRTFLLEMAALLAKHEIGQMIPVAIVKDAAYMDQQELKRRLSRHEKLLRKTVLWGQELGVNTRSALRIDDDIALGISRVSREQHANLIVMGWSNTTGLRARLFGSVIDHVICAAHCPVMVARLLMSPSAMKTILVPVNDLSGETLKTIHWAQILADANCARLLLFYAHETQHLAAAFHPQEFMAQLGAIANVGQDRQGRTTLEMVETYSVVDAIVTAAQSVDLVMMHSVRYQTAGGLAASDVTARIMEGIQCSLILLGDG